MEENNNIEDFFKKRLERNEFSYEEADWQSLEAKLDQEMPVGSTISVSPVRLLVIGAIATVGVFLLGWFLHGYFDLQQEKYRSPQESEALPMAEGVATEISQLKGEAAQEQEVSDEFESGASTMVPPAAKASAHLTNNDQPQVETTKPDAEGMGTGLIEDGQVGEDEGLSRWSQLFLTRKTVTGQQPPLPRLLVPTKNPQEPQALQYIQEEKAGSEGRFAQRWSVGVALAPDFNSVGMNQPGKLTALVGGRVIFRITDRWAISGGALLNRKRYESSGEAYTLPSGYQDYQLQGEVPDRVDGSCRVLDIPVMVSYDIPVGSRFFFSPSVGISNYFLLDEEYHFEFDKYSSTEPTSWETDENSKVMWGVANLSCAVGLRLTERWTVSAEPYLKKPMQEIGWGKIDLVSAGTLFMVRYQLFGTR